MTNTLKLLLLLTFLTFPAHAADSPSAKDELVELARTFRTQSAGVSRKEDLEKIKSGLNPAESERKRFALLLDGFVSLYTEGDLKKVEAVKASLAQEKDLAEWERYCLRVLQASIEGKQGKGSEERQSIEWLCENLAVLEEGKKTSKLCAALIEGLEKGKGPFEAGLQLSRAGNLVESGREDEAKVIYRAVMEKFPGSGWAISAKNRLNYLENKNAIGEMMEQETQSGHMKK